MNIVISSTMVAVLNQGFANYNQSNQQVKKHKHRRNSVFKRAHTKAIEDIDQMQQDIQIHNKEDFVSPYCIYNSTGYAIKIQSMNNNHRVHILENGKRMNWEILQDISKLQKELREDDIINNVKVKFSLLGTDKPYSTVENINIDRIRVQRKIL